MQVFRKWPFLPWLLCLVGAFSAQAQNTFLPSIKDQNLILPNHSFLEPNELHPVDALPLWEKSPLGMYLAVGTERGFMAAGANPNATHLLLVDRDPQVTQFNRINTALLELAKNREDYLDLRFWDSFNTWKQRAAAARQDGKLSEWAFDFLSKESTWNWWASNSRSKLSEFEHSIDPKYKFFEKVSYLAHDDHFEKLSKMAKEQKIQANTLQLTDYQELPRLVQSIRNSGIPLGTVDISNAYWDEYMKYHELVFLLKQLGIVASPKTQLLITRGYARHWNYQAIEFEYLKHSEAAAHKLQTFPVIFYKRRAAVLNPKEFVRLNHPGFCVRIFSKGLKALNNFLTPTAGP